jgi:hypothetical protein
MAAATFIFTLTMRKIVSKPLKILAGDDNDEAKSILYDCENCIQEYYGKNAPGSQGTHLNLTLLRSIISLL